MTQKRNDNAKAIQKTLFGVQSPPTIPNHEVIVIDTKKKFNELFFSGVTSIKGVTFGASPDLILKMFKERNLEEIEIINSEKFPLNVKAEVIDELEKLKNEGKLKCFYPEDGYSKTIHSKVYLIQRGSGLDFVIGSANLTESAQNAYRQKNAVVIFHDILNSPFKNMYLNVYEEHKQGTKLFLDSLTQMIEQENETDRLELIKQYIIQDGVGLEKTKYYDAVSYVSDKMLDQDKLVSPRIEYSLDGVNQITAKAIKKRYDNLKSFNMQDNKIIFDSNEYYERIFSGEFSGIPLLKVYPDKKEVRLRYGNNISSRAVHLPDDPQKIYNELMLFEKYFETVDNYGEKNADPTNSKMALFEAALYVFWCPFAGIIHQYLARENALSDKGLPFGWWYGPSNTGKTTFASYLMSVLTGKPTTKIIKAGEIKGAQIENIKLYGTSAPLIVDDVGGHFMNSLKNILTKYWTEKYWTDNIYSSIPQIVFTTNKIQPQRWLNTRVMKIPFTTLFNMNDRKTQQEFNKIKDTIPDIFPYFAYLFMDSLESDILNNDMLYHSRAIFKELYSFAGRSVPNYFPEHPLSSEFDPNKNRWLSLFDQKGIEYEATENNELKITFPLTTEGKEIDGYIRILDKTIDAEQNVKTITIRNLDTFQKWVGRDFTKTTPKQKPSFLARLIRRVGGDSS